MLTGSATIFLFEKKSVILWHSQYILAYSFTTQSTLKMIIPIFFSCLKKIYTANTNEFTQPIQMWLQFHNPINFKNDYWAKFSKFTTTWLKFTTWLAASQPNQLVFEQNLAQPNQLVFEQNLAQPNEPVWKISHSLTQVDNPINWLQNYTSRLTAVKFSNLIGFEQNLAKF